MEMNFSHENMLTFVPWWRSHVGTLLCLVGTKAHLMLKSSTYVQVLLLHWLTEIPYFITKSFGYLAPVSNDDVKK